MLQSWGNIVRVSKEKDQVVQRVCFIYQNKHFILLTFYAKNAEERMEGLCATLALVLRGHK